MKRKSVDDAALESEIARLPDLDLPELRACWKKLFGHPAPKSLRRKFLAKAVAYQMRVEAYGGLSPVVRRRLREIADAVRRGDVDAVLGSPGIKRGTQMIRQWKGKTLTVTALDNGFEFEGRIFSSLSAIAKAITGTKREDGTFSRSDFRYDPASDVYHCRGGKRLGTSGTVHEGKTLLYRASKLDSDVCPLKPQCCPKEPSRKVPRDIHEHARDVARSFAGTEAFRQSRRERKKIEMRFAHLKRILRLGRLRLRGPRGAQDEFVLAAIAQNLMRLAALVARPPPSTVQCAA